MPKIKCQKPDATYLLWLDFRDLNLSAEELQKFCLMEGNIALDVGAWFGGDGEGFMRLNIGCSRQLLEKGLTQLYDAYRKRGF